MSKHYQVVIIGSGIAGMTAGIYLKRGGLDPVIIEESAPGGQLNKVNVIENYPGFVKTDGPTLAYEVYNQVKKLKIDYIYDKVIKTDFKNKIKLKTSKETITCDYLIIATGKISRKLFNNDDKYIGKGISYCALCDSNLYKNKDVIVVGGGPSAMEESLYLAKTSKSVTVINRKDAFHGEQRLIDELNTKKNIKVVYNSSISEYNIENGNLESVTLDNGDIIKASGLFISIGSVPSTGIFEVKKDKGFIVVNKDCMTNVKNVYACGDVIKKSVYQLTTAVSEGTIAANSILKELDKSIKN
jgi:thioredoxin reductase (NADPH)